MSGPRNEGAAPLNAFYSPRTRSNIVNGLSAFGAAPLASLLGVGKIGRLNVLNEGDVFKVAAAGGAGP